MPSRERVYQLAALGLTVALLVAIALTVRIAQAPGPRPSDIPAAVASFAAQADARVEEGNRGTNFGTSSRLRADGGSSEVESYLRFSVSNLSGTVQSAKLRVYASDSSKDGPAVYATGSSWSETGITWSNRPARSGGALDNKGAVSASTWVEFNVTSLVKGNGAYSFTLVPTSSDGVNFPSREAGSNKPQLVVTTSTATVAPTPTPTATVPSTPVASFAAQADARVEEGNRGTNFGTSSRLRADGGSSEVESYLRFSVSNLSGTVQSAKLRVYASDSSKDGPAVYATGSSWSETGITWSNRPARSGGALDNKGAVSASTWVEFNVTSLVKGNGAYSFALVPTSSDGVNFPSREAGSNKPQLVVTTSTATVAPTPTPSTTVPSTPSLTSLISDVTTATRYRYGARDNLGNSMDTLKVIQNPAGGYLGVYHTLTGADFTSKLATSTDLLSWTWKADIDFHSSQPAIAALDNGGFVVALEYDAHDGKGAHLRFIRYSSLATLLGDTRQTQFDAPRSFSACAEGTPNIYSASPAGNDLDVGFHYFASCDVDRQARGTLTNFSSWTPRTEQALDSAILGAGQAAGFPIGGNIGDRDAVSYGGKDWNIHEGQGTKGSFGSWRPFLYDRAAGTAQKLGVRTHKGSTAFANGTLTNLRSPSGKPAVLVTHFIPSEGAALGEGGTLIYYKEYGSTAPAPTNTPVPGPAPTNTPTPAPTNTPAPTTDAGIKVAAAGDISCSPSSSSYNGGAGTSSSCAQKRTSDLLVAGKYASILVPGDIQYETGSLSNFQTAYDPTWGRVKAITRPVPGNHEYGTSGAAGYFDYFGGQAGERGKGYYSFDLGPYWHAVAINSNCSQVGGCDSASAQYKWLAADLDANRGKHVIAYWHHPRYSSGSHGNSSSMDPIWDLLYAKGAEIVLEGHDHDYERFAPMNASGARDDARGLRSFVVGMGGKSHYGFGTIQPNSVARNSDTYGILELTLRQTGYDWRFVPEPGKTYSDSGTSPVH